MAAPALGLASFANAGRQGNRLYIQYGGLGVPVGNNFGASLPYIDLNDGVNWHAQDLILPDSHELEIAQQLWRAKQAYVSEDWGPLVVTIPYQFHAVNGKGFWTTVRPLTTYGEQVLTFDGTHGFYARCKSVGKARVLNNGIADASEDLSGSLGEWWGGELEFWMREPFVKTIALSSQLGTAISGGAGGVQTNFSVTYAGTFAAEPQWVLNVPNTNTQVITQLKIQNTSSGETAVIALNLSANTAHTVTIDSSLFSVSVDSAANDIGGSFPMLYAGTNNVTVTLTAAGATTGVTMDVKWYERWA